MRALIILTSLLVLTTVFAVDSLNISLLAELELAPLRGIDVDGGYIFALAKSSKLYSIEYVCGGGLFIMDSIMWSGFTMPSSTHLTGRWLDCQNGLAFVADWTSGLRVFDVSNPYNIHEDTAYAPSGQIRSVYAIGDTLFAAANASGVHVFDISSGLDYLTTVGIGSAALDVAGRTDGTFLVAEDGADFSVWNLTDPSSPLSFETIAGDAIRVIDGGDCAFIALE